MKTTDCIVLGAGIVGVSTALALQARGHSVVLVDRKSPGQEASFGNAGIIQREAVEPYAFPRDLPTLVSAAAGRLNSVNFHLRALPALAGPLFKYWRHSASQRHAVISAAYSGLIQRSIDEHDPWIRASGADHLVRKAGWYQIYRSARHHADAVLNAVRLQDQYGLKFSAMSGDELAAAEPSLVRPMAGAIWWQDPWTVSDPGKLVQMYADLFLKNGGTLVHGDASSLNQQDFGWAVRVDGTTISAPIAVVALGAWSNELLRAHGYKLPLFIKRGYHRHYTMASKINAPMLDAERGIMLAPMRKGLRISTGAEFASLEAPPTPVQSHQSEQFLRELLELGTPVELEPWMGSRPCTPDMKPVIGPAYLHKGLWFNFGHAHQGLTLGPASARLLAEQIEGKATFVDATPFLPVRFRT